MNNNQLPQFLHDPVVDIIRYPIGLAFAAHLRRSLSSTEEHRLSAHCSYC